MLTGNGVKKNSPRQAMNLSCAYSKPAQVSPLSTELNSFFTLERNFYHLYMRKLVLVRLLFHN